MSIEDAFPAGIFQQYVQCCFTRSEFEIVQQVLNSHGYTMTNSEAFISKKPDCHDGYMVWNPKIAASTIYNGAFFAITDAHPFTPVLCAVAKGNLYIHPPRQLYVDDHFKFLFKIPGIRSSGPYELPLDIT
jgi:hypothetical protein